MPVAEASLTTERLREICALFNGNGPHPITAHAVCFDHGARAEELPFRRDALIKGSIASAFFGAALTFPGLARSEPLLKSDGLGSSGPA